MVPEHVCFLPEKPSHVEGILVFDVVANVVLGLMFVSRNNLLIFKAEFLFLFLSLNAGNHRISQQAVNFERYLPVVSNDILLLPTK